MADDDGVSSSLLSAGAQNAASRLREREGHEGAKRIKLASGVLGLMMYNMREPLEKVGLRYID